jgi:hypothetical protein
MQFFSFLRFLANNYKVAYVTSSINDLQQMCHDKEISDSPFFNIFSNLPLRPFSRSDAQELITIPSQHEGVPLEAHADRIIELSGLFPMFIQMACSNAFEHLIELEDGEEPDWTEITRSFVDEAAPHFKFVWESMEEGQRATMARVARGATLEPKLQHVSEGLLRLGYLVESNNGPAVFSAPFRSFILDQDDAPGAKKSFWGKLLGRG